MPKALFGLGFAPAAVAFLDGMPPGKLRARISRKAQSLVLDPHPPGCKKLKGVMDGDDPVWRIRSGAYRILYIVREVEIVILDIGHRKDVYK
ncbi:MAG: type II toxin-antitoxin system RelE/ParE family toxin [SAR324 cluster bacterium]|nr:type II toxin-antitoxin system RelE/ParE family toxin [SAR324 cluster bacterium]